MRSTRFGQLRLNLLDDVDGGGQRAAFVVGVAGPDDFTVVVDERGLDGGGTSVDAQEVRAVRASRVPMWMCSLWWRLLKSSRSASVGNSGGMVGVLEGRFFSSSKRFRISSQV